MVGRFNSTKGKPVGIFSRKDSIEIIHADEMEDVFIDGGEPALIRSNLRRFVRRSKVANVAHALVFLPLVIAVMAVIAVGPILPVGSDAKYQTIIAICLAGFVGMFVGIALVFKTKFALMYTALIFAILGLGTLMYWGFDRLVAWLLV